MKTGSALRATWVAALLLANAVAGAQAIEIKGSGVSPLRTGDDQLTIGGMTGRSGTDPTARKCYGSTLCNESGTYYSDKGVLHYKNGDRLNSEERPTGIKKVPIPATKP